MPEDWIAAATDATEGFERAVDIHRLRVILAIMGGPRVPGVANSKDDQCFSVSAAADLPAM